MLHVNNNSSFSVAAYEAWHKIMKLMTKLFLYTQQYITEPMAMLLVLEGAKYWPLH
jgi:hypothetical protein